MVKILRYIKRLYDMYLYPRSDMYQRRALAALLLHGSIIITHKCTNISAECEEDERVAHDICFLYKDY